MAGVTLLRDGLVAAVAATVRTFIVAGPGGLPIYVNAPLSVDRQFIAPGAYINVRF